MGQYKFIDRDYYASSIFIDFTEAFKAGHKNTRAL